MATGAGIVVALIVAGVIVLDIFLLGRHFDRQINELNSKKELFKD